MSENSIREALEASFEQETVENEATSVESPPSSPPPVSEDPPPSTEPQVEKPTRDYVRDEMGKFAPKEDKGTPQEQKPPVIGEKPLTEGIKEGPKVGQPPVMEDKVAKDPIARAPTSWKPEAREHWTQIPEAARREIARVDQLVQQTMRESAEARRFADTMSQVVAPYRGTIEAEGSNVVQAVGHLLQTAQALRTAPPGHKASLVAGMIKQFGIDVQMLDKALIGAMPEQVNPEVAQVKQQFERELAPLRQMQQQMLMQQQYEAQQRQALAQEKVQQFEQTQPEFLADVAQDMANILELGAQRGVEYTLEQAYELACRAHPEIRRVIEQREQAKVAQSLTNTAHKAKQAAVSLGGAPSLGGDDKSANSVRDAILLAMNQGSR